MMRARRTQTSPKDSTNPDPNALVEWSNLSPWQRDNEYILTGYRQASFSVWQSTKSMLRVHNETVNIWSHTLGTVAFSIIPFSMYHSMSMRYEFATQTDSFALFTYFASVTVCFLFSSTFHTLMNHSPSVSYLTSQLDHLGIVLVIWGSTIPQAHFGHYCNLRLQHLYWYVATTAATLCALVTFHPRVRTPAGRKLRVLLYMLLGLSSFSPGIHGVYLNGYKEQDRRMGISYFIGLGVLNGMGAGLYGARIPERWYPKRFDIWGSSHQIMHVLVMCGAWYNSVGLLKSFDYWHGLNGKAVCEALYAGAG